MEEVREGIYVHVDGHLKSFRGERHVDVFSVRHVKNFNEITFHFVSCIHNHVRTSNDQKMQGNNTTTSDSLNSTPHMPIQNGTNGSKSAPQIRCHHLKIVGGMSAEQRKVLLFFWTSVKYLPVEGFCGLASRLCITKTNETIDRLPSSHTCFYQICFPAYPSMTVMQQRLNIITQEHIGCSFGTW